MHTTDLDVRLASSHDAPAAEYYHHHSSAPRINTDVVILNAIEEQYPQKHVTITPERNCDLIGYAAAGHAVANSVNDANQRLCSKWRSYIPPAKRLGGDTGELVDMVLFGKYHYAWRNHEFILYLVDGRDGVGGFPVRNNYIVGDESAASQLILEVGNFNANLHNQIWVFNQSSWSKDAELWKSISNASWKDVILDEEMKQAIANDVLRFFDSRSTYTNLKVPWKRGIIFHGPPGNGKTISIKATMHMLYQRKTPIPTLYVKTLASFYPPEWMLARVFEKARQEAPCYLVFEDLDSIVTDRVRSFFLNEVDGLANNDGILMVGSTNHLDRLDPGISKRPSRFDRKYYFPIPDKDERVKYCEYWQGKLSDNKDLDFPHRLCTAIADITDGFSFAYMQEAFVAALLIIAGRSNSPAGDGSIDCRGGQTWQQSSHNFLSLATFSLDDSDLDKFILWQEIKLQIKTLREGLEGKNNLPSLKVGTLTETRIEGDSLRNGLEGLKNFHPLPRPDAPADNDAVHDFLQDDLAKTKKFFPPLHKSYALPNVLEGRTTVPPPPQDGACGDLSGLQYYQMQLMLLEQQRKRKSNTTNVTIAQGDPIASTEGRISVPPPPKVGACGGNHALQDYQMQLMLLEQQYKKRNAMTRQKENNTTDITVAQGTPIASTGKTMRAPPISIPTHPNSETTFGAFPLSIREKVDPSCHHFSGTPKYNHAFQDPEVQLKLLEEQDGKRSMMGRQTLDNVARNSVPQTMRVASTLQEKAPCGPSTPAPNNTTIDTGSPSSLPETTSSRKSDTWTENHAPLDLLDFQTQAELLTQNSRFRMAMARLDGSISIHCNEAQKVLELRNEHAEVIIRRQATLPTATTIVGTDATSVPEVLHSFKSEFMTRNQALKDCSMQLTLLELAQKKRSMTHEQDKIAIGEAATAFVRARAALMKVNELYDLKKFLKPTSEAAAPLPPKEEHNLSPHRSTDGIRDPLPEAEDCSRRGPTPVERKPSAKAQSMRNMMAEFEGWRGSA